MTRKDKSGAPPTESLYTTKKHSSSSGDETAQQRHQGNDINNFEETLRSHFHPEHHNDSESMKSPAQIDPFFAEGRLFGLIHSPGKLETQRKIRADDHKFIPKVRNY